MDSKRKVTSTSVAGSGGKIRVQTGCITCRIRRVKCDETKPSCDRCLKTGRKCDGYTTTPVSRTTLTLAHRNRDDRPVSNLVRYGYHVSPRQSPGASGMDSSEENNHFAFFQTRTAVKTNALINSDFWDRLVLQIAHSEPAVKHAVLALSSLHRDWEFSGYPANASDGTETNKFALTQYHKAVSHAGKLVSQQQGQSHQDRESVEKVLVICILFICYENLVGNYGAAKMHLRNGLKILGGHRNRLESRGQRLEEHVEDDVVHLLGRFNFQAMTFSEDSEPYDYYTDGLERSPLPLEFTTLAEASHFLFDIVQHLFRIGEVAYAPNPEENLQFQLMKRQCENELARWEVLLDQFLATSTPDSKKRNQQAVSLLRMYHITAGYIISAGFTGREMAYDDCMEQFSTILSLAESISFSKVAPSRSVRISSSDTSSSTQSPVDKVEGDHRIISEPAPSDSRPSSTMGHTLRPLKPRSSSPPTNDEKIFSLELGIIAPLFNLAMKCRDPFLRRRAIAILEACNRREGVWDCTRAARVAERVIRFEEKGEAVEDASQIAEEGRVVVLLPAVNLQRKEVKLRLLTRPRGLDGGWEVKEDCVDL